MTLLKSLITLSYLLLKEPFITRNSKLLNNGIIIKKKFLDKSTCDEIKKKVKDIILIKKDEIKIRDSYDSYERYDTGMIDISNIDLLYNQLKKKIKYLEIKKVIESELKKKIKLKNINCYINKGVSNTRVFHCDSFGSGQHKSFIYLTDVPNDSYGPYSYIKDSHREILLKFKNIFVNYFKGFPITDGRSHNEKKVIKCYGEKGDLIITSQDGFHRGIPQKEKKERILIMVNFLS